MILSLLSLSFIVTVPAIQADVPADNPATVPATAQTDRGAGREVKTATLELSTEATGFFAPVDAFEIKPKPQAYGGDLKIKATAAQGVAVKKGDVLIELDRTDYDAAVAAAGRDLTLANANLAKVKTAQTIAVAADKIGYDQQSRATANAIADIKWWDKVDGPLMLSQWEMQIKQVADRADDQADELDQLKKMYKSEELTNATADIVVKRAVRELAEIKQSLAMIQQRVDKQKQTEYTEARQRVVEAAESQKQALEMLKAEQATHEPQRAAELAAAEEAVKTAEKKSIELATDEALFKVVAPADGVAYLGELAGGAWARTDAEAVKPGEKIAAGQVVMTFVDPAKMRLEVGLTEEQASRVTEGLPAWVTPTALPELACGGKTTAPKIVPDGQGGTYTLRITLDRAYDRLRPGMKAAVSIDLPDAENVFVVPNASVKNGRVVVLKEDGKTETRDVVLGRTDGTLYEVVSGLAAGEHVAE